MPNQSMGWWSSVGCGSFSDEMYGDVKTSANNLRGQNIRWRIVPVPCRLTWPPNQFVHLITYYEDDILYIIPESLGSLRYNILNWSIVTIILDSLRGRWKMVQVYNGRCERVTYGTALAWDFLDLSKSISTKCCSMLRPLCYLNVN
jgi:hypothetical protein